MLLTDWRSVAVTVGRRPAHRVCQAVSRQPSRQGTGHVRTGRRRDTDECACTRLPGHGGGHLGVRVPPLTRKREGFSRRG